MVIESSLALFHQVSAGVQFHFFVPPLCSFHPLPLSFSPSDMIDFQVTFYMRTFFCMFVCFKHTIVGYTFQVFFTLLNAKTRSV